MFQYQSFPYNKNTFKVGMKLEGVDPEHQSMYCVLTVAEVSIGTVQNRGLLGLSTS